MENVNEARQFYLHVLILINPFKLSKFRES